MTHLWRRVTALAGLLVASAGSVVAQQGTSGSLAVRVTDAANQRPVEAARVFLVGTTIAGQTTAEGRVTLRPVAPGQYSVRILRVGYTEQTKVLTVAAGQAATLDVALTAAAVRPPSAPSPAAAAAPAATIRAGSVTSIRKKSRTSKS